MIVADTNLIAHLMIDVGRSKVAQYLYHKDPIWAVPRLWEFEFQNVLATSVRTGALSHHECDAAWENAIQLFRNSTHELTGTNVLDRAHQFGISAYDAHFVQLAFELNVNLVTEDRKLRQAAPNLTLSLSEALRL